LEGIGIDWDADDVIFLDENINTTKITEVLFRW
jgi:hypothetical protein